MGFLTDLGTFKQENIIISSQVTTCEEVIEQLVQRLQEVYALDFDIEEIVAELLARESKGSTAIAPGVAIPHIRTVAVDKLFMAVALHKRGIDCKAFDKTVTHIVILSLFPSGEHQLALKFLAHLSRFLLSQDVCNQLLAAQNEQQILQLLQKNL